MKTKSIYKGEEKDHEATDNSPEWVKDAIKFLTKISNGIRDGKKCLMLLRHSERENSTNPEILKSLGLTDLGKKMAQKFGSQIPNDIQINIKYSISPRCIETAEEIINGFRRVGGIYLNPKKIKPIKTLPMSSDNNYAIQLMILHPQYKFLKLWKEGNFPEAKLIPFNRFYENLSRILLETLNRPDINCFIVVTHDIFIAGLLLYWFNDNIVNEDWWPSFLGGAAILFKKNTASLILSGEDGYIPLGNSWNTIMKYFQQNN
ncbi:MAG: histidine phosphatase family protein [Promethearchaeota archaeon]